MDETSIARYISESFDGLNVIETTGDYFFIYDPARDLPPNRQIPFATLITNDQYDRVSDLNRPGVFRLNIGVSRATYERLIPPPPEGGFDLRALDQLLPHPEYGRMHWVCVLNPSDATWEAIRPLLAEAYELVVERVARAPRPAT